VYTGFWWGNLRVRDHLEDPGIDGRIILRWKWDMGAWTGSIWLRTAAGADNVYLQLPPGLNPTAVNKKYTNINISKMVKMLQCPSDMKHEYCE
jgi:hypothetical protein